MKDAAAALRLLAAAAFVLTAAYQVTLPATVDFGASLPAALVARGLHGPEDGFRWTGGHGIIDVPGPGPGRTVEVEAAVSAWRPRGTPAPRLRVGAEGVWVEAQPAAPTEVQLVTTTTSRWRGDVEVRLESETFSPGRSDPRLLGVRLHRLRLSSAHGPFAPGRPPLLPVLWALACVQLVFWGGLAAGRPRAARRAGMAAALLLGLGLVVARLWTVRLVPFAVAAEIATILALIALPRPVRLVAAVIGEASGRLARALGALRPAPVLSIAILAAAGALAAYRLRPVVEIPLGGGRETAFEEGLGSFDARDGVRFRHLPARASLDLRDLGGGGSWRVDVTAALGGPSRSVPLLDLGRGPVAATLGPQWSTHEATAAAPLGWRGGLRLDFPASRRDDIWLHEVRIDRGRVWPPARAVVAIALTSLLMAVALLAGGVAVATAWASAVIVVILESLALLLDPVAAIPELPRLVAIASLGAAVTSVAAAIAGRAERSLLPPAAIAAGGVGFMAWLATSTAPLYRGGHFVFHSSIAEEIWKGRFLLYYLPYPGSMLSQQAQWGNVIVPHPCLYHTLVAPLAALPRPAFFAAEKVFLALLLASMVWATAALAARIGPPAAAVPAAVLMAAMPAAYQLLGLGHLMTILGCWAMTLAMTYLVLRIESLGQRGPWWRAVLLLTLCFLAYTAGLLFTGMVIAATALVLARSRPEIARPLVGAAFAAGLLAFALYYVHWTWPFLSESVPRLFTGAGAQPDSSAGALPMRLGALPHKLAYTFGSALLPLVGLSGLLLVRRGPERVLMLAWGAVLPVFMGLDLAFNFLLKHHYFTMVPVAVGGGAALAAIAGRGRAGRVLAAVVLVAVALLGARVALDAAMGRIP